MPQGGVTHATQQTQFQLTFFAKQFIQVIFQIYEQPLFKLTLKFWLQPILFVSRAELPLLDESQQPRWLQRRCVLLSLPEPPIGKADPAAGASPESEPTCWFPDLPDAETDVLLRSPPRLCVLSGVLDGFRVRNVLREGLLRRKRTVL